MTNKKVEQLLPIGSIVTLVDGEQKLMINGVMQRDGKKDYDYTSVLYPQGYSGDEQFVFNHEDIKEISFVGYSDSERTEFLEQLDALYTEELNKKTVKKHFWSK